MQFPESALMMSQRALTFLLGYKQCVASTIFFAGKENQVGCVQTLNMAFYWIVPNARLWSLNQNL